MNQPLPSAVVPDAVAEPPYWDAVESLVARAPNTEALNAHRLHLIAARLLRALGRDVPAALAEQELSANIAVLTAPPLLERARAAYAGRIVLMKGLEVAELYPEPALRPFGDLDLLVDDSRAAQRALLDAGFMEVGEPILFENIHHLRPLALSGFPMCIELHHAPKWPDRLGAAPTAERLLNAAVPSATGVDGIEALAPADHAVALAAHAWAHEPLLRIGHLLDVAFVSSQTSEAALAACAAEFDFVRPWAATQSAIGAVFRGERHPLPLRTWARNVVDVRSRSVLEWHLHKWMAPFSEAPFPRSAGESLRAVIDDLQPIDDEGWRNKGRRAAHAVRHALIPQTEHDAAVGEDAKLGTPLRQMRDRSDS